ncbi:MAG TPA: hypothetical protein DEH78_31075, partial [Solibacterales bacterium]|nr:hypothetical protein [Bryobacterales bacterium]
EWEFIYDPTKDKSRQRAAGQMGMTPQGQQQPGMGGGPFGSGTNTNPGFGSMGSGGFGQSGFGSGSSGGFGSGSSG